MARPYLELVGVLLQSSRPNKSYSISYLYRLSVGGNLGGNIVMKGYDMALIERFDVLAQKVQDAYAPCLQRAWGQGTATHDSVYLELIPGYDPKAVALSGHWSCFLEA